MQACVVPFRRRDDQLEICLITSLKKQHWILPKGIVDPGETCEETALKEALEEAGLHGQIVGEPLGNYEDAKWNSKLDVTVFIMEVTQCDENWFEENVRLRRWMGPKQASALLSKPVFGQFVESAVKRIGEH